MGSWEWDIPRNVVWWSDELYRIYGLEPRSILPVTDRERARNVEAQLAAADALRRRAMEINDEIIQRLVLAGAHLERDAAADAAASIADARRCAQQIVDDLLVISSEPRPGDLRREAGIG